MKIILNGEKMKTKDIAHKYIKDKLDLTEYYGENLDALWDILSTYNEEIEIELICKERLIEYLGEYGEAIIEVFQDVEEENLRIKFNMI